MMAGYGNASPYQDAVPLSRDSRLNPHGVGYTVERHALDVSGGYDVDPARVRVFHAVYPVVRDPVNNAPAGYKIVASPC